MSRNRQLWIWLAVLVAAALILYMINGVLLPFLLGIAIAYFLDPVANQLVRLGCSRLIATVIITFAFFICIIAVLVLIAPLLQGQLGQMANKMPDLIQKANAWIAPLKADVQRLVPDTDMSDIEDASKSFLGSFVTGVGHVLQGIWKGGLAVVNLLSLVIITPVVSFYLLRDWNVMVSKIDTWLPRDFAPSIRTLLREIDDTIAAFVRGQGTVVLVLAAVNAIGLTIIGVDFGLLIGIVAGLLSFIPYVGTVIGLGAALIVAFVQFGDFVHPGFVLAVFAVSHMLEGYFLAPKLIGDKVGLHPVWIIFAIMVGGYLLGFTGVLLAVPVAATIGVLVRFFLGRYLVSTLYSGATDDDLMR